LNLSLEREVNTGQKVKILKKTLMLDRDLANAKTGLLLGIEGVENNSRGGGEAVKRESGPEKSRV